MAPNYIRDLLTIRPQGRNSLRSHTSIVLEVPRGKMLRSFGDRSFSMAAPKLWNELPLQCVTFQHLVFLKGTSKRIFLS